MKSRLEKIKDANEVLNYNNPAWKEEVGWVINEAEKVEKYKKQLKMMSIMKNSLNDRHKELLEHLLELGLGYYIVKNDDGSFQMPDELKEKDFIGEVVTLCYEILEDNATEKVGK